jgi:hypothetical protein
MKTVWWHWIVLAWILFPLFGLLIVLPVYSNYIVCKEYYPKLNPLVCLMSSKTKIGTP